MDVAAPIRQDVRNRPDIFVARQFLSRSECASWIALSEASGFRPAPIHTPSGPQRVAEVRNNERLIRDDPELASLQSATINRVAEAVDSVGIELSRAVGL